MSRPTLPTVDLLSFFDRTYVLNLPERSDRRRQTERELRRHFPGSSVADRVRYYPAIRPDDKGGFKKVGSHGCFLSVIDMLTTAEAEGLGSVLVLQDDVRFTPSFAKHERWLLDELSAVPWDYVQLGYIDGRGEVAQRCTAGPALVDFDGQVTGAHCVGFNGSVIGQMLEHLHAVLNGEPGDRLLGPMPVDGAFNTFKWLHPGAVRLLPVPNLVEQRKSRSDISPKKHDQIPGFRRVTEGARAALDRFRTPSFPRS